jgi:hypothetical protein
MRDERIRGSRGRPAGEDDEVEHEDEDRADGDQISERDPGCDALRKLERLVREGRSGEEERRTRRHRDGIHRDGVDGREPAHEHGGLREAERAAECGEQRQGRYRGHERRSRHHHDSGERDERSHDRSRAEALLPLEDREQERRERYDREEDLSKAGVDVDEGLVREAERSTEVERAEDERAGHRPSAWEREPQRGHCRRQHGGREGEPEACAPERRELPVAEPDTNGVPARKERSGDEGGKRRAFALRRHARRLRPALASAGEHRFAAPPTLDRPGAAETRNGLEIRRSVP